MMTRHCILLNIPTFTYGVAPPVLTRLQNFHAISGTSNPPNIALVPCLTLFHWNGMILMDNIFCNFFRRLFPWDVHSPFSLLHTSSCCALNHWPSILRRTIIALMRLMAVDSRISLFALFIGSTEAMLSLLYIKMSRDIAHQSIGCCLLSGTSSK